MTREVEEIYQEIASANMLDFLYRVEKGVLKPLSLSARVLDLLEREEREDSKEVITFT